jgi:hypothetical protein
LSEPRAEVIPGAYEKQSGAHGNEQEREQGSKSSVHGAGKMRGGRSSRPPL